MEPVKRLFGCGLLCLALVASASHAQGLRKLLHRESHPKGYDAMTVHCESTGGRWRLCPANVDNGVRLVRQVSDAACIRRQSWGVRTNGIWVSSGCSGDFELGGDGGTDADSDSGSRLVRCESRNGMRQVCRVDTGQGVRLRRRLSNLPCDEGGSWGYETDGIWVRRGCRADFAIDVPPVAAPDPVPAPVIGNGAHTVRCESQSGGQRTCAAAGYHDAVLKQQRSHTQCVRNSNWWLVPQGIRVSGGCRGDFAVW